MALYLIGDLQSCASPFKLLLEKIDFNPSTDELVLLGDMLNRGPESLETLEVILSLGGAARCLLGNHDIHFLSVAYGLRTQRPHDTLTPILESKKLNAYIDWMRQQHMALYDQNWLMVHAGVAQEWTLEDTLAYAKEVENIIQGADVKDFLKEIFGNQPDRWSSNLTGIDRLRFIVNALTRMRYCYADGRLDMKHQLGLESAPEYLTPWYALPNRKTENIPIAFGHWSTLKHIQPQPTLLALDTGCLWGGQLTAARIENKKAPEIIQVQCETSIAPIKARYP